jgi:hypothetical protein
MEINWFSLLYLLKSCPNYYLLSSLRILMSWVEKPVSLQFEIIILSSEKLHLKKIDVDKWSSITKIRDISWYLA